MVNVIIALLAEHSRNSVILVLGLGLALRTIDVGLGLGRKVRPWPSYQALGLKFKAKAKAKARPKPIILVECVFPRVVSQCGHIVLACLKIELNCTETK